MRITIRVRLTALFAALFHHCCRRARGDLVRVRRARHDSRGAGAGARERLAKRACRSRDSGVHCGRPDSNGKTPWRRRCARSTSRLARTSSPIFSSGPSSPSRSAPWSQSASPIGSRGECCGPSTRSRGPRTLCPSRPSTGGCRTTVPPDEFGRLKTAFNGMLARLESAFESRQRFASDASHELRTPLAVMQASADNVLGSARPSKQARDLAEEVQRQVSRSDSLMESLLTLSRADDVTNTRERVDLADVAARVVTEYEPRATAAGIRLELDVEDAPVSADPILMERLIANLVDNAIRYNVESDGWVTCAVRTVDGAAQVEVANSGPAVETVEVAELFRAVPARCAALRGQRARPWPADRFPRGRRARRHGCRGSWARGRAQGDSDDSWSRIGRTRRPITLALRRGPCGAISMQC